MGTPLGPKYIPYTYIDPLGRVEGVWGFGASGLGLFRGLISLKPQP